jgi:hypothetical protein
MATQVTVNAGQGSTQVTVITGEGSTTYSVSTGARGPASQPVFSTTAPADTTVPWVNTTSRPYVLNYYYNGAWEAIGGGTSTIDNGYTFGGNFYTNLAGDFYTQPAA